MEDLISRITIDTMRATKGDSVAVAVNYAIRETMRLMFDPVRDVQSFHELHKINYEGKPRALPFELLQFRLKFLREEIAEYEQHGDAGNFIIDESQFALVARDDAELVHHLNEMLDALCDLVYVALGTAHLQGFDFRAAWARVHKANMAKIIDDKATSAEHRMKLKLTKPPGWEEPDHKDLVEDHAHR